MLVIFRRRACRQAKRRQRKEITIRQSQVFSFSADYSISVSWVCAWNLIKRTYSVWSSFFTLFWHLGRCFWGLNWTKREVWNCSLCLCHLSVRSILIEKLRYHCTELSSMIFTSRPSASSSTTPMSASSANHCSVAVHGRYLISDRFCDALKDHRRWTSLGKGSQLASGPVPRI